MASKNMFSDLNAGDMEKYNKRNESTLKLQQLTELENQIKEVEEETERDVNWANSTLEFCKKIVSVNKDLIDEVIEYRITKLQDEANFIIKKADEDAKNAALQSKKAKELANQQEISEIISAIDELNSSDVSSYWCEEVEKLAERVKKLTASQKSKCKNLTYLDEMLSKAKLFKEAQELDEKIKELRKVARKGEAWAKKFEAFEEAFSTDALPYMKEAKSIDSLRKEYEKIQNAPIIKKYNAILIDLENGDSSEDVVKKFKELRKGLADIEINLEDYINDFSSRFKSAGLIVGKLEKEIKANADAQKLKEKELEVEEELKQQQLLIEKQKVELEKKKIEQANKEKENAHKQALAKIEAEKEREKLKLQQEEKDKKEAERQKAIAKQEAKEKKAKFNKVLGIILVGLLFVGFIYFLIQKKDVLLFTITGSVIILAIYAVLMKTAFNTRYIETRRNCLISANVLLGLALAAIATLYILKQENVYAIIGGVIALAIYVSLMITSMVTHYKDTRKICLLISNIMLGIVAVVALIILVILTRNAWVCAALISLGLLGICLWMRISGDFTELELIVYIFEFVGLIALCIIAVYSEFWLITLICVAPVVFASLFMYDYDYMDEIAVAFTWLNGMVVFASVIIIIVGLFGFNFFTRGAVVDNANILVSYNEEKFGGVTISYEVEDGVTQIGENAFDNYNCKNNLEEVILPSTVTKINAEAFYNCKKLTQMTFSANLTYIDSDAFEYQTLEKITFIGTIEEWNSIQKPGWINEKISTGKLKLVLVNN